jgi:hypothetical protein
MADQLTQKERAVTFTHVYFWRKFGHGRKGQLCNVIARGKLNSICVEFADGYKMITNRRAVRRVK